VSRIETAQVTHGGYVRVGSEIYAASDRGLMCISPADGEVKWNVRDVLPGTIHYADGRLYCYRDNGGVVVLVEPDAVGFRERGRFSVPGSGPGWACPVVADKRLLVRYGDMGDTLYAYDVAATDDIAPAILPFRRDGSGLLSIGGSGIKWIAREQ